MWLGWGCASHAAAEASTQPGRCWLGVAAGGCQVGVGSGQDPRGGTGMGAHTDGHGGGRQACACHAGGVLICMAAMVLLVLLVVWHVLWSL